ncbi:MAG: GAF domain-containing protein [Candidatus Eremiobacteraeota bacterium]|nr:GAF domain-containing protein [Candidatus Eremiobacteraeota bacterium]
MWNAFDPVYVMGFGAQMISDNTAPSTFDVRKVKQGGEADKLGIKDGDRLFLLDSGPLAKARLLNLRPGDAFRFRDVSKPGSPLLTLHAVHLENMSAERFANLYLLISLALVLTGALVAVRRADRSDARALGSFFIGFAFVFSSNSGPIPDWVALTRALLVQATLYFSLAQMTRFACLFPFESADGIRALIRRITPLISVAVGIISVGATALFYFTTINSTNALLGFTALGTLYYVIAVTCAFQIANRRSTGPDHLRSMWASLSLAVGFSGLVVTVIAEVVFLNFGDWQNFAQLTILAIPAGMSYVLLRHRMLDLGFVINRAVVFGAISLFIVGVLTLVEFILGKYALELSHTSSTLIEAGFALGLGVSMRPIHDRIDRVVDDLFFWRRHLAERELRAFADEAAFITERKRLLDLTIEVVAAQMRSDGAAVLIDVDGVFGLAASSLPIHAIDENDRGILRMKAQRKAVDLREAGSALAADVGLPMFVRGRFMGALLCGHKPESESYAPDEVAVLQHVAHSVGIALDSLETEELRAKLRSNLP